MSTVIVPVAGNPARRAGRLGAAARWALPLAVVVVLWWVVAVAFASLRVIPTPGEVVGALVSDASTYPPNLATTLLNAIAGYLVGNAAAIALALLFVRLPWAERILMRIGMISFCIPLVALTPILTVILPGEMPKQALAAVSVFFTTLVSCVVGLRSADPTSLDVIRSMGGSDTTALVKVRLRAMLPSLFSGLQIAAPAAVLGAILGEYLGATSGLGVMLISAQASFEVPRTWAVAIVMSALSGLLFLITGWVGRKATPWAGTQSTLGRPPGTASAGRLGGVVSAVVGAFGSLLLIVVAWWGMIALFRLDPYFAKGPVDVWNFLFASPHSAQNRATIGEGLRITLVDAGLGYLIGTVVAVVLAIAVSISRHAESAVMPIALVARSVPLVAMTPVLALVFGRGLLGVTVIVSLVTFFPTLISVIGAIRSSPQVTADLVRSMGGSAALVTLRARLPYAIPAVFAAGRIAVPGAIAGATLAEWLATGSGLGSMLVQDFAASRFDQLWTEAVVVIAVSAIAYTIIDAIERPVSARFGF